MARIDRYEKVTLIKRNGRRISDISAHIQSDMVFTDAVEILVETGDVIERFLPNGLVERYSIVEPKYYSGGRTRRANYQIAVHLEGSHTGLNLSPTFNSHTLPREDTAIEDKLPTQISSDTQPTRAIERSAGTGAHDVSRFGIVTALSEEFAAMCAMLDNVSNVAVPNDPNEYRLGDVSAADGNGVHRVVVTLLKKAGNNSAATAASHLLRSFPSVDDVLMVGIAGGCPCPSDVGKHVRLGDCVVSNHGLYSTTMSS